MNSHTIYDAYVYDIYDPKVLKPGDHICSFFETDEQPINALTGFIKEGLINNDRVIYFCSELNKELLLYQLSTQITDLEKILYNGQLSIITSKETYIQRESFCPDQQINFLKEACVQSNQGGYAQLRAIGDMTWALNLNVSVEDLLRFESRLNRELFWDYNCIGLCQYDMRLFNPDIINTQLDVHPVCHIDNEFYPNQYYIPPESYLTEDYKTSVLHHKITQIKERKKREKYIAMLYKQTEELREFSHLLVHDLKGPINSANTLVTMLKEDTSPEIINRLLSVLTQTKNRIDSITHLNSVSRNHNTKNSINLNHLLEKLVENYKEEIKKMGGSIELIQGDIKLVSVHEKQMIQLFSNLIDNSIKYRQENEALQVTITTQMLDNNEVKISIQDNGIGFPSYMKDKIFSPFFRSPTVLDIEGTGIGLAICQRIIHKYNGHIVAKGKEGVGTTVDVFLPAF